MPSPLSAESRLFRIVQDQNHFLWLVFWRLYRSRVRGRATLDLYRHLGTNQSSGPTRKEVMSDEKERLTLATEYATPEYAYRSQTTFVPEESKSVN